MSECNSIETNNIYSNLSDQIRLVKINKIKDYFNLEIQERRILSKKLSKYIATLDYIDKTLIVLSATTGGVSIIYFASVIVAPAGMASASFTLVFSLTTGIIKKVLKIKRNKKKKHNKIVILGKSKLNNIEILIPQALIDLEISHKEFETIVNEKESMKKISLQHNKNCVYNIIDKEKTL